MNTVIIVIRLLKYDIKTS